MNDFAAFMDAGRIEIKDCRDGILALRLRITAVESAMSHAVDLHMAPMPQQASEEVTMQKRQRLPRPSRPITQPSTRPLLPRR